LPVDLRSMEGLDRILNEGKVNFMLTNEQLEDLATIHIVPQIDAGQTLDLMPILRAVEAAAIAGEREACAITCEAVWPGNIHGASDHYIDGKEMALTQAALTQAALTQAALTIRMRSNAVLNGRPEAQP
jgi:hypothetical protein